jgi:hypothetical protein
MTVAGCTTIVRFSQEKPLKMRGTVQRGEGPASFYGAAAENELPKAGLDLIKKM